MNRSARTACLKATRHITKGEEVFVPYGAAYWNQFARLKQAKADAARERHPDQPDRLAAMLTEGLDVLRALRSAAAADESYAKLVAGPRAAGDQRVERDGLLLYKSRICVPEDQALRTRIVGELHDTPLGGHLGRDKTLAAVKQRFYWSGMDAQVAAYVAGCDACQRDEPSQRATPGKLMSLPVPAAPFDQVSLDLITGLPRTPNGDDAIVVFVCKLSKYVLFAPTRVTVTAPQLAQLCLRVLVRAHGFPHSLLSDRDPRFTGHLWRAFWAMAGTTLSMSTAYHPQTDGQTERTNRTLEQMLRPYLKPDKSDWAERLWHAELAINSAVQASTGRSPFSLVYGREPNMPLDQALGPLRPGATPCPAATDLMERQRQSWAEAAQAVERAQARQAKSADASRRAVRYAVGDQVLLDTSDIKLAGSVSRKLEPLYAGPFRVTAVVNDNAYTLALPEQLRSLHPTVNVSRLKPYVDGREKFPSRTQPLARPPPEATGDNGAPVYQVEAITKRRVVRGVEQFLVRWAGYPVEESTWEPRANLNGAQRLLKKFLASEAGRQGR